MTSTPLGPSYEPRASTGDVGLYSVKTPECPFEEIALVTAYTEPLFVSTSDAIQALKRRVAAMGGDAVVGLTEFEPADGDSNGGVRGTAIRFTDSSCRR